MFIVCYYILFYEHFVKKKIIIKKKCVGEVFYCIYLVFIACIDCFYLFFSFYYFNSPHFIACGLYIHLSS